MKQKIFTTAIVIAALLLPLESIAKGKPSNESDNVVLLKDASGLEIGRVIGMESVSQPYVLTDQGYRTAIALPLGMVNTKIHTYLNSSVNIVYESIDCTGVAYVSHFRYLGTVYTPVVSAEVAYNAGAIFYTPHDAQLVTVNVNSMLDMSDYLNINCSPAAGIVDVYPAHSNDPSITGIQNTAYPAPMLME